MYTIPGWYVGILAVSATVAALLGVSLLRYRDRSTVRWLLAVLFGVSFWTVTQIAIVVRRGLDLGQPALLDELGLAPLGLVGPYVGSAVTLVALLMFALEYTGSEHLVTRRTVLAVAVVPAIVVVGAVTNGYHSLFWASLEHAEDLDGWAWSKGPLLVLNNVYSYVLSLVAAGVLVRWSIRARSVYRGQAIAVVASVLVPLALNVSWFVGVVPVDLTEVGFTATGLFLWAAMVSYDLGNLLPVAQTTVVENIAVGVLVVDRGDRIVDSNRSARRLLGLDESVVGTDIQTALDPLDAEESLTDAVQTSVIARVEQPHGSRIVNVDVTPLYDRREEKIGRVFLLQDVTERRERRRELERQNERLEEFASTLSHDLRNPLNVAKMRLDITRQEREDEHVAEAAAALDRMEELIEDTLALARTGQPVEDTELVRVSTVAEDAWAMVDSTTGKLVVDDDLELEADPTRLQRLFENLFRNAVEHGCTTADADSEADFQDENGVTVRVGSCPGGFYVEDDGPGIPVADRESVFRSGYTTTDDGTGFGLAIVEEIVEAHGWEIGVTDSTDGGARFEVTGVAPLVEAQHPS